MINYVLIGIQTYMECLKFLINFFFKFLIEQLFYLYILLYFLLRNWLVRLRNLFNFQGICNFIFLVEFQFSNLLFQFVYLSFHLLNFIFIQCINFLRLFFYFDKLLKYFATCFKCGFTLNQSLLCLGSKICYCFF